MRGLMEQLSIFDFLKPDPEELLEIKDENIPRIVEYISRETGLDFKLNEKRAGQKYSTRAEMCATERIKTRKQLI